MKHKTRWKCKRTRAEWRKMGKGRKEYGEKTGKESYNSFTNLTDWPTLIGGGEEREPSRALRDLGCLGTMTARAAAPLLLSFSYD